VIWEPEQEKLYEEEKSKARNALFKTDGSGIDKINIINVDAFEGN
jgi:non-specific serine/threonine protein kinase